MNKNKLTDNWMRAMADKWRELERKYKDLEEQLHRDSDLLHIRIKKLEQAKSAAERVLVARDLEAGDKFGVVDSEDEEYASHKFEVIRINGHGDNESVWAIDDKSKCLHRFDPDDRVERIA